MLAFKRRSLSFQVNDQWSFVILAINWAKYNDFRTLASFCKLISTFGVSYVAFSPPIQIRIINAWINSLYVLLAIFLIALLHWYLLTSFHISPQGPLPCLCLRNLEKRTEDFEGRLVSSSLAGYPARVIFSLQHVMQRLAVEFMLWLNVNAVNTSWRDAEGSPNSLYYACTSCFWEISAGSVGALEVHRVAKNRTGGWLYRSVVQSGAL